MRAACNENGRRHSEYYEVVNGSVVSSSSASSIPLVLMVDKAAIR